MTDARGVVSDYDYDDGGRTTAVSYPSNGLPDLIFTYDITNIGSLTESNNGKLGRVWDGLIRTDSYFPMSSLGPQATYRHVYPGKKKYSVFEQRDFEGNLTRSFYPVSYDSVYFDYDSDGQVTRIRWLPRGATPT